MLAFWGKKGLLILCFSCFTAFLMGMYENETDVDSYLRFKESSSFKKVRTPKREKQKKEYSNTISTGEATVEARQYLDHLFTKNNISLNTDEKKRLLTITQGLIIKASNTTDTTIESSALRKIKKALKQHLKFLFPKNFSTKKEKAADLHVRLARKKIRATIKDYLEFSCAISDPKEVRRLWKSVKPLVESKLEAAVTVNDVYQHVVPISKIQKIILATKEELVNSGIRPIASTQPQEKSTNEKRISPTTKKKEWRTHSPQRKSRRAKSKKRSPRKFEKAISLTTASQEIQAALTHTSLTEKEQARVHTIIMRRLLSQTTPHSRLLPSSIKQVMDEEIMNAQNAKKTFSPQPGTPRSSTGATRSLHRTRPLVVPMAIEAE